jgi:hypothetical protein
MPACRTLAVCAACAVAVLPWGCTLLTDLDPLQGGGAAGATGAGAGGASSGGSQTSSAGGGPPCPILHVSPDGDDVDSGCDAAAPKRTIQAAISAARSDALEGAVIRVCAGTYAGPVVLDHPVGLEGGYDCESWGRPPGYGFPEFPEATKTEITGDGSVAPALLVIGRAIGQQTVIDGFHVRGGRSQGSSMALHVKDGAAPHLSNDRIEGGTGTPSEGFGSVALRTSGGAAPLVEASWIGGGSGLADVGSAAVVVDSDAAPHIRGCTLHGGAGSEALSSGGIGSVGAYLAVSSAAGLTQALGRAFEDNDIDGGTGTSSADATSSAGMIVSGEGAIDLVGNRIHAGAGEGGTTTGVIVATSGKARLLRNRVHGGAGSGAVARAAVQLSSGAGQEIINNMLHGGDGADVTIGVALAATETAAVVHNSIHAGLGATAQGVLLAAGVQWATIENNILFGRDSGDSASLALADCADSGPIGALRNNAIGHPLVYTGAGPGCSGQVVAVSDIEPELTSNCGPATPGPCQAFGGAAATATVDVSCQVPCGPQLFDPWTDADGGGSELLTAGWLLGSGVACAVSDGAAPGEVTEDLFGAPRTEPPSMGAHEHDGACQR